MKAVLGVGFLALGLGNSGYPQILADAVAQCTCRLQAQTPPSPDPFLPNLWGGRGEGVESNLQLHLPVQPCITPTLPSPYSFLAGGGSFQGRLLFEDPERSLSITNYIRAEGGVDLEKGGYSFWATGNPLRIASRLQGFLMEAPRAEGLVGRGPDPRDEKRIVSFVQELDATGNATVTFDSKVQYAALLEHATRFKLDPPAPDDSEETATLKTERFTYRGDQRQGTFTIPSSFDIEFKSTGEKEVETKGATPDQTRKAKRRTDGFATMRGGSGVIAMLPAERGLKQLRMVVIKGRPTFHLTRTETTEGNPQPQVSIMDGEADEVRFSFGESRTVTLIGNVVFTGSTSAYAGSTEADKAVITLDEGMKPIRIRFTGNPIKSRIGENKAGGGRAR